jgi:hypothetical protein
MYDFDIMNVVKVPIGGPTREDWPGILPRMVCSLPGRHITLRCSIRKFRVEGSNLCRMMPIRDGLRCRMLMSQGEYPRLEINMKWSHSRGRVSEKDY